MGNRGRSEGVLKRGEEEGDICGGVREWEGGEVGMAGCQQVYSCENGEG